MKYILYGFIWAIISAVGVSFVTNMQGIKLPPIYYIGFVVLFTPFIAWCRYKEIKRKNGEKDDE